MARPPRPIAWLHANLGFGGGERVLVEQVRAMEPTGRPVDVWVTVGDSPQELAPAVRAANRHVRRIETVVSASTLARRLFFARYEAIFTCWTVRAYRALRKLERVPCWRPPVVLETVHERYGWCIEHDDGRRSRLVDHWLATYDFRDVLSASFGVPLDRISVARPLFASLATPDAEGARARGRALRARLGIPPQARVVGYAGRLSGNKNLEKLVALVGRLAGRGLDVHLVLAGRHAPPVPEFVARLDAAVAAARAPGSPLAGRLHLLGPVEDTREVYAAADVVPLLSHMEGLFPLMLVEAMALGVPVVTTDVGGIGTCLTDGRDAAVVAKVPDDEREPTPAVVAAFEARLGRLLSDDAERARLGTAGRERVAALLAGNDFHADTRAALERALAQGPRRR